jgi:aminopeptidase N
LLVALFLLIIHHASRIAGASSHIAMIKSEPEPGVSRDLARWRAARYRAIRYALNIELAPKAEMLRGRVEIGVTLDDPADDLILDWRPAAARPNQPQARVWAISVNGREAHDARQFNEHIIIPGTRLIKGENLLRMEFESPISPAGSAVTRYLDREDGSEYIYTLFVPSDASTTFPCFDQPDLKARFTLEATFPAAWQIISNANVDNSGPAEKNEYRHARFGWTEPLSTYQFAFAAGPFAEFRDDTSRIPMRLFVRRSKAERARKELAEVFRLHRAALDYFAAYFDRRFPFPKYDLVVVPEFAYGGMEHAGATFLREEAILFPTDPTANDLLARAELMFHETAHQWFGDLVTMRWFDDLWLKEGFATFMAYKAVNKLMPEYNAWKAFYQRTKPAAYLTDVTKGTTPIWQEIPNLSAAKSAYGNIVYRKAPSMLRQAEYFLGPEAFQRAIQMFVREHAFGNAEWADLVRCFERASGKKLESWAAAWVRRRGMADVRVEWSVDRRGRIDHLALRQTDVLSEGGAWPMRIKLLLAYDDASPVSIAVALDGAGETTVAEARGLRRPAFVFANYEDYGYGRFLLDEQSRVAVIERLGTIRDDFLRALLWGALWDSVREAELAPAVYIDLGLKHLAAERDEVTAQSVLGRMQAAYNRYLSEAQMQEIAPRLEEMIFDQMMKAETVGLRITYFRAYQSVATTDGARARLKRILRGELSVPGMNLRPRDRFDIITTLLARGDQDAPALLEKQSREDTTDDGRRYAFAAGAARREQGTKEKYFTSYLNDSALAESWIEASLEPFNTVSQSELTLRYLEPALDELPRLKRTRKIFFVNRWLAAFIGGQCSERALATVQKFLETKQLDHDLRLKVLEAVDGLERCVRIRGKYGAQVQGSRLKA